MKITRIEPFRHKLGEGPVWDQAEQVLYGCDLLSPGLWRYDPASDSYRTWSFLNALDSPQAMVGSFALTSPADALGCERDVRRSQTRSALRHSVDGVEAAK